MGSMQGNWVDTGQVDATTARYQVTALDNRGMVKATSRNFVLQTVKLLECGGILRDSAESTHLFWKLES